MVDETSVVARLEQLSQEYNVLSQYLTSQRSAVAQQGTSGIPSMSSNKDNRITELEKEARSLTQQLEKVNWEKDSLEQLSQQKEKENTKLIGQMKQELKDCFNDTEVLKDVIKRLNEQLNRYHLKYGKLREDTTEAVKQHMNHDSIYKLGALLTAYDEVIAERDAVLKANADKFEQLMVSIDAVTSENEKLHVSLEKLKKNVPMGSEEAEMVAADAKLLLEERELLLEEIHVLRQQSSKESAENHQQVSRLQHELEDSHAQAVSLSAEVDSLKTELTKLEKQCKVLQEELANTVSKEEHQLAVDECQRLFVKLRQSYTEESGGLKGKVQAVKHEKRNLAEKLTDSSAHVHTLSVQVSGLKGSLRKTEHRMKRREKALQALQTAARNAQTRLKSLAEVCSELLEDREKLLEALAVQRKESEDLSRELTLKSAAVGALSQKLKEERVSLSGKLAEIEGGRQAAKAAWKRSMKENNHLRSLNAAKDETITSLVTDYKMLGLEAGEAKQRNLRQSLPKANNLPGNF